MESNIVSVQSKLDALSPIQPDRSPAFVYLSGLPSKRSQRTMHGSLKTLVQMFDSRAEVNNYSIFIFPWWELDYQHTQAIRSKLIDSEYTPSSINRLLSALRGVLKECWRLGFMDVEAYNRAADLENVKDVKLPAGRYIPKTDIQKMLSVCYADTNRALGVRDAALIALLYLVGPRREEISKLTLQDYDPNEGTLLLKGKGRKERQVYVVGDCREKLDDWLNIRGVEDGRLFYHVEKNSNLNHEGITGNAIWGVVAKRAAQSGLGKTTPHDFRRSAVSNLLDAGVDPITVAAITGHASIEMVKRYDRRKEQPKIDALKKMTLT